MKYTFVLTQIIKCPSVVQWGWLVSNSVHLCEYLEQKSKYHANAYMNAKKAIADKRHFIKDEYIYPRLLNKYDKDGLGPKRKTIADDLRIIDDAFLKVPVEIFEQYGSFLAWQNMCTLCTTNGYKYLREIKKDILSFPEENYTENDIKITQWTGGSHYYAKLGNKDVVVNGDVKWNTHRQAKSAAMKYLKKIN